MPFQYPVQRGAGEDSVRKVLIVCIGNELVADDGIGQVVYHELLKREKELPHGVRLQFLGLGGIDLLEELQGEDLLLVVDGVQLGREVGSVVELGWDDLPEGEGRPVSGHGVGVREAIHVAKRLYPERCPERVMLIGVEGACFDILGVGLSPSVEKAIPGAVSRIMSIVAGCA